MTTYLFHHAYGYNYYPFLPFSFIISLLGGIAQSRMPKNGMKLLYCNKIFEFVLQMENAVWLENAIYNTPRHFISMKLLFTFYS